MSLFFITFYFLKRKRYFFPREYRHFLFMISPHVPKCVLPLLTLIIRTDIFIVGSSLNPHNPKKYKHNNECYLTKFWVLVAGRTSRLSMISLLRRNRKKTPKAQQLADQELHKPSQHTRNRQRPATRNHLSERFQKSKSKVEIYQDDSLDSLVFAASLGLVSTKADTKVIILPDGRTVPSSPQKKQNQRSANQSQGLEFRCRFCGKGYRWKSTMRRHETLECGDKPPSFQCPQCPYRARQRGNLTVHIKRHHTKE
ncbi:longitudinals lacking protein, isoforms F/I/K/T-like [Phymastichus coffea]|uniref:longitudinals lacking protein, isoforms F/I/K/T-like n=1 Tax=Phymastichus coffea TaxID=108790 RepID=UPI00273B07E1|nr:longitudinals lacking protein, isoforms F/I/K/T-like [Phymastichus coffea]